MTDRPVMGTNDWDRMRVTAPIPEGARLVRFGALLPGNGTAWFDDFQIELVDIDALGLPSAEVEHYVASAIDIMQRHSIRRGALDWDALRAAALDSVRSISTTEEAHFAVRAALARLGDNHSVFVAPERARQIENSGPGDDALMPWISPTGRVIDGRVGYVLVPAMLGTHETRMTRFADELQGLIARLDSPSICGWIVDLRSNGGGNVFPMLAGLGPLLGEGDVGGGVLADGERHIRHYQNGASGAAHVSGMPYHLLVPDPPVAVLIGPRTASSGEATALAFVGRSKSRTFGRPSAGLTTGNRGFELADGALLNLSVSIMTDRLGRRYGGTIEPDELVDSPAERAAVSAALDWLGAEFDCGR